MQTAATSWSPDVYATLVARFRATPPNQLPQRWLLLESAHVVGQTRLRHHLQVHQLMLGLAWEPADGPEAVGQLFRLLLVPLGHVLQRLPLGNPGRANVSAFQPMPPSPAIRKTIAEAVGEPPIFRA